MDTNQGTTRRAFMKASGLAIGATVAGSGAGSRAAGANERPVVAVIGCGGMGRNHARHLGSRKDVTLAYACDVDARRRKRAKKEGGADHAVEDLRRVLDDKAVDAVWIPTPDHWHAPAAILACEAGKHVYVEKPCSHNIREGRLMVEAASRHGRVMQLGTQSRSSEAFAEALGKLRDGAIGDVLVAKVINSQRRSNIGHAEPTDPPDPINYDLWVGPAAWKDYQPNLLHYNWHWFYKFGTGDIGNDGVHQIDIARWGLGDPSHPDRAFGYGSKLFFDDDQQFPDTMQVSFEYGAGEGVGNKRQIVFEMRIWSPYKQEKVGNGNVFYGTDGKLVMSRGLGWRIVKDGNVVEKGPPGVHLDRHHTNFLDAIRKGKPLNAPIDNGHRSSTLCHLGNIVARTGRNVEFDGKRERIVGDKEANALVSRSYREGHWAVPARG